MRRTGSGGRKPLPSRTALLDLFESADGPLDIDMLSERLGVASESRDGFLRLLDDLVFDGVLTARGQTFKLEKRRDGAPASRSPSTATKPKAVDKSQNGKSALSPVPVPVPVPDHLASRPKKGLPPREAPRAQKAKGNARDRRAGILSVNARGFGFVASPTATGDDVYINPDALSGAMHGDHVVVEITNRGNRGPEGQIVEVTKRSTTRVSGILRRRGKSAWVELDDPRVRGPVVLTSELDTKGPEGNSGQDGNVVIAEILRFPEQPGENPEGCLIAVLGQPGELSVEVNKVLMIAGIEEVHSAEAIAEAEAYGLEVPLEMLAGREDLTHIPLPTIDPDDARDHDDAVWVARSASGGYDVWVAIADVSSYVRPETQIDEESRDRGCSIYLPDRAIPMLPRALSSNLCSLLPDVVRLCLCVHAELDAKGTIRKSRLIRGYMKSAAKLTYGGVARALGFTEEPPVQPKAEEMVEGLRVAYECSRLLRTRRMKRGALDFDLPEPVIKLDSAGKPISVTKRAKDLGVKKAYQLIEELMIFANEVVARWLLDHELPGIYRVHLPPDPQKLAKLAAMCEVLGIELDIEATQTPKGLADILASFVDHPNAAVLNSLLLRSMKQAAYDTSNLGHFGLASDAYLHFTSPIRRYPDLVVHRIVHAATIGNGGKKAVAKIASPEDLQEAAMRSSSNERKAMEVEREILDIYRCFYMIDRIGERFEGTISAFVGSGAFVTLDEPFVDVMIKLEDFGGDYVIEDDGLMATSKRNGDSIRLGERIMVEIMDCAILRRTVYARRARGDGESGEPTPFRRRGAPAPDTRNARGPQKGRPDPRGGKSQPQQQQGGSKNRGGGGGPPGKKQKKSGGKKRR